MRMFWLNGINWKGISVTIVLVGLMITIAQGIGRYYGRITERAVANTKMEDCIEHNIGRLNVIEDDIVVIQNDRVIRWEANNEKIANLDKKIDGVVKDIGWIREDIGDIKEDLNKLVNNKQ